MTKKEILKTIAEKHNVNIKDVQKILDSYNSFILNELETFGECKVLELGKAKIRKTKQRTGRNPATGATIVIPAKKKLVFSFNKTMKDNFNK